MVHLMNMYALLIIILVGIIIYQIHKYGLRGYMDHRLERKRRTYDKIFDAIQNI